MIHDSALTAMLRQLAMIIPTFSLKARTISPKHVELVQILPHSSRVLATLLEQIYNDNTLGWMELGGLVDANIELAFEGVDPLPIAMELLMREPLMWSEYHALNHPRIPVAYI